MRAILLAAGRGTRLGPLGAGRPKCLLRLGGRTLIERLIDGLGAAGMDAASEIYSDTYPFILPASAMGFAINSGRIAGENAAKFVSGE